MALNYMTLLDIDSTAETDPYQNMILQAGLEYVQNNTILDFDINNADDIINLPASVKLFVMRYADLTGQNGNVTSESIEGLSQSFGDGSNLMANLIKYARELLRPWLKSGVTCSGTAKPWRYGK